MDSRRSHARPPRRSSLHGPSPLSRGWPGGLLVLLLLVAGCAAEPPDRRVVDYSSQLAGGARYAERLRQQQETGHPAMAEAEVIALGYLERLRLGLGSPFRLMEYAWRDPRLPTATRTRLTWALLHATVDGGAYEVDPYALTGMGVDARHRTCRAGSLHLDLIERTVQGAVDARAGELAVREAYRLAAAAHDVSPLAPTLAAAAAALVRDREAARRDAGRLLVFAGHGGRHPFQVLQEWRRQRRFAVESPAAGAPVADAGESLAGRAAALHGEVRRVVDQLRRMPADGTPDGTLPLLHPGAAGRLSVVSRAGAQPPQAPVWITVNRYDELLRRLVRARGAEDQVVGQLLRHARTEETFAAEHALARHASPAARPTLALVALETSVALRAYTQERVWYPGYPAPTDRDLKQRFGLRAVEFDAEVPTSWRAYHRRMLADALADLELVLPNLDLRGATFRFGRTGREGSALAIHDPYGRAIHLPVESGAGAVAHEVGHDLDWQVARARYRTRAAYGTELAARGTGSDRFATAARQMPAPPEAPIRGGPEVQRRYAQRPAEIFARTFDGYVAAMLAQRGRSNGYLTAAQDESITGHGLAIAPGARDRTAETFMDLLMVASPVPDGSRRESLLRWGSQRVRTASEAATLVLAGAPGPLPGVAAPGEEPSMTEVIGAGEAVRREAAAVQRLGDDTLLRWETARCANPLVAAGPREAAEVHRLVDAAVEARVRGIVVRQARALGFDAVPEWLHALWVPPPVARRLPPAPRPPCGPLDALVPGEAAGRG